MLPATRSVSRRVLLDLANALGGQMDLVADGLQRLRSAIEAVARAQHRSFPIVKVIRHVPQSVGIELSLDGVIAILGSRIGKQIRERAGGAVFALELLFERAWAELDAHETVELIVAYNRCARQAPHSRARGDTPSHDLAARA